MTKSVDRLRNLATPLKGLNLKHIQIISGREVGLNRHILAWVWSSKQLRSYSTFGKFDSPTKGYKKQSFFQRQPKKHGEKLGGVRHGVFTPFVKKVLKNVLCFENLVS